MVVFDSSDTIYTSSSGSEELSENEDEDKNKNEKMKKDMQRYVKRIMNSKGMIE